MTGAPYTVLQGVLAVATMVFLGVFGYESYVGGQCNQMVNERVASSQAQLDTVQRRIDKIHARQESLQARSGEPIKKFDGPDSGQGSKQ
jgi:hypothetical protein